MKKASLCVLLVLCLALPVLALCEGWVCSFCGIQWADTDNFCGVCGAVRHAANPVICVEDAGRDYVQISWSGFSGAAEYRIYIGDAATDTWSRVGKTSSCSYEFTDLEPGTVFDVRVKSDNGLQAVYSGASSKAAPTPTPIPTPTPTPTATPVPTPTPIPVQTASPANLTDSLLYRTLDDGTVMITGYIGTATSIVIPSEIGGRRVSVIGAYAFTENKDSYGTKVLSQGNGVTVPHQLTRVAIPAGVRSIGDYAFYNCTDLKYINIPEGVTSIGNYAFRYCTSLANITLPVSVTSIGDDAFLYCNSLTTITVTRTSYAREWCKNHGFSQKLSFR